MAEPPATDVFSKEKRSAVMRQVKSTGTAPEIALRKLLTGLGLRYRLHRKDLPGKPDIVFSGRRTALFVHGCFWHGHDCARGARAPKANADYWQAKIARNRARDARVQAELASLGWRPFVVWECELRDRAGLATRLRTVLGLPAIAGGDRSVGLGAVNDGDGGEVEPRTGPVDLSGPVGGEEAVVHKDE